MSQEVCRTHVEGPRYILTLMDNACDIDIFIICVLLSYYAFPTFHHIVRITSSASHSLPSLFKRPTHPDHTILHLEARLQNLS